MATEKHDYEVWMGTHIGIRVEKFPAEDFENVKDQEAALFDLINGCKSSKTEYTVFKDGQLINL